MTNPSFGGTGDGLFASVLYTPRSIDLMGLPYQSPLDGSNVYYRRGSTIENPRWNLNNKRDIENLERFYGNIQLSYELTDWLTAVYRFSLITIRRSTKELLTEVLIEVIMMVTTTRLMKINLERSRS